MINLNIGKTLLMKRAEKGITQGELAAFIGVSKASVSKWEKGHSYPDITFLPQLASFFSISMDELMGYEPQMSEADIQKSVPELIARFKALPFDEAMAHCREVIKKYYACVPLLFQMGLAFLNYGQANKGVSPHFADFLNEAKSLFVQVKEVSDNAILRQHAINMEACCELYLGKAENAVILLEEECSQPSSFSMKANLAQAYFMLGNEKEAKGTLQSSIAGHLITLLFEMAFYMTYCADDKNRLDEVSRRALALINLFQFDKSNPSTVMHFYMRAAIGYVKADAEKALDMLDAYGETAKNLIFPITIRGDDFFDLIEEHRCNHEGKLSVDLLKLPLDEQSIRRQNVQTVTTSPYLTPLHDHPRYREIVNKLHKILLNEEATK